MKLQLKSVQSNATTVNTTPGTVLFISHDTSRTGGSIFLLRFLRWLRKNTDLQFRVLVGSRGELYKDFQSLCPVDSFETELTLYYRVIRKLKVNGRYSARHLSALRQKLAAIDIRLIYANTAATGEMIDFLSFAKCPVICHVHELEGTICNLGDQNNAIAKNRASVYIAVSDAVKKNLVQKHGISEERVRMVHGFIPIPQQPEQSAVGVRSRVFLELGMPESSKLVCACGSIEHRKGTDLFLQVAQEVINNCGSEAVHFVWVGGRAELVSQLRAQVLSSPLRPVVHFIGARSDTTPYYAASDAFLISSREDPFPLVMMEAALQGTPIVCFDKSGGAPEFVEHDAGFIIPAFDVNAMAERVTCLLLSPELAKSMGAAARDKVMARHDLKVGAPRLLEIIRNELLPTRL